MKIRQIKAILFLLSIIAFSSCDSPDNQQQTQTIPQNDSQKSLQPIRVSTAGIDSAEPATAASQDGTVFIVWVEHTANKSADVMLQKYDSNGQLKGEKVRVNPQIGKATAWRGDPPTIKIGQDGTIYVGWTEKAESEKGSANNLYLSVSRDGGNSFESPVKVNDDSVPASHGMHSLAVDNAGRVYFVWLDERYLSSQKEQANIQNDSAEVFRFEKTAFFHHKESEEKTEPNAELYFSVSNDNGKTFLPNKRLAENVCPCCKTSLLAASDEHVYAVWRQVLTGDFRHIAIASSTDNGESFSSPVIVSDDRWQIYACPVSGASIMTNSDDNLSVVWFTAGKAGKQGLYLSESKDAGKTFSPRSLISESSISGTPLLLSDETMPNRIVWEDNGKMMTTFQNENPNTENKQQFGEGELISATTNAGHLLVAYIKRENEKRSVWLMTLK